MSQKTKTYLAVGAIMFAALFSGLFVLVAYALGMNKALVAFGFAIGTTIFVTVAAVCLSIGIAHYPYK
jgi:hypothetical protein